MSFAILDTNHLRELVGGSVAGSHLKKRIQDESADVFTCIVVVEESLQGWMALLNRERPGPAQVGTYGRMLATLDGAMKLGVLPFDDEAAEVFSALRAEFPRRGTMDLKIAATCLVHDALLLTRNVGDFREIPGLRFENWLD